MSESIKISKIKKGSCVGTAVCKHSGCKNKVRFWAEITTVAAGEDWTITEFWCKAHRPQIHLTASASAALRHDKKNAKTA